MKFTRYPSSKRTWRRHQVWVRIQLGFRLFDADGDTANLTERLVEQAYRLPAQRDLFTQAIGWFREHHVELPPEDALRRLVNSARQKFFEQLYTEIYSRLDDDTRSQMTQCLNERKRKTPANGDEAMEEGEDNKLTTTTYDWMKSAPGKLGLATILDEVEKLCFIREFNRVQLLSIGDAAAK